MRPRSEVKKEIRIASYILVSIMSIYLITYLIFGLFLAIVTSNLIPLIMLTIFPFIKVSWFLYLTYELWEGKFWAQIILMISLAIAGFYHILDGALNDTYIPLIDGIINFTILGILIYSIYK